ncbi:MAG TPA: NAD-dependent epimerase/dehydratase family protein [Clostridia bacterium]|nr:NAD-dependent epimerase/dehydratase family protein [Clostridia bacterium]
MKLLVTGGAGFIGSHVVDLLVSLKHQVIVVDNLVTGKKENVNERAVLYEVDICSPQLEDVFRSESPEAVFHLAAQATVPRSLEDPLYDAEVNIAGTLNILEMMHRYGAGRIIYSSSAAIYGNPVELPVVEEHPLAPVSPYGLSKYVAEEYITLYSRMYGIDYMILRYANVYGPRQTLEGEAGVVTIFINNLKKGFPLTINGDGRHTRDFVFVGDVAQANAEGLTAGRNGVVNIGTGRETSLQELVDCLQAAAGKKAQVVYGPERPGDIVRSCLCPEKGEKLLGWKAVTPLSEGLKRTIEA